MTDVEGPTASEVLLVEVADAVATVTLHRPQARNALNRELRKALVTTMLTLDERDDVAAVVLTGADPAFCAGLDLKELAAGGDALRGTGAAGVRSDHRGPFPDMATPVIGAVNGVAITGGFELALRCDFLVASERARFADTHARVGIMPGWGLTVELPAAVGLRRAKELSTTGNFLDASTALAWGLVNHVVPHEELLPFARALATDIAGVEATAVRQMLATYDEGARLDGAGAWDLEAEVAGRWQGEGLDPAVIEAKRQAVVARGRSQL
ncbi:MAG: enoyl-CoA hydratase [Acidimicrobiales bacterium]|nr:enoyl-CoA hydratase [Acidimicrobiales bacterium]